MSSEIGCHTRVEDYETRVVRRIVNDALTSQQVRCLSLSIASGPGMSLARFVQSCVAIEDDRVVLVPAEVRSSRIVRGDEKSISVVPNQLRETEQGSCHL